MKRKLILATAIVGVGLALPSGASAAPFAYVTNFFDNDVSQFDVGSGGLLAPLSPPTVAAGHLPRGIAVSPDGRSVYVANQGPDPDCEPPPPCSGGDTVSQYDVGPNGELSPKHPATVAAGDGPRGITVRRASTSPTPSRGAASQEPSPSTTSARAGGSPPRTRREWPPTTVPPRSR